MKIVTLRLSVLMLFSILTAWAQPGRLNVAVKAADAALKDRPAMVSAVGNGSIVRQYEVLLVDAQ